MAVHAHTLPRLSSCLLTVADQIKVLAARRSSFSKPTLRYGAIDTPCVASTKRPGIAHVPMDVQVVLP